MTTSFQGRLRAAALAGAAVAVMLASDVRGADARQLPRVTVAQANAIQAAKDYLQETPFSRAGLIEQLSSSAGSGFPMAVAVFAVNHIKVNWNTEAVQAAKNYLQESAFSRSGLIEQLSSSAGSAFTAAQAQYAIAHIKVNWNAEAVQAAKQYLRESPFSCQGLVEQLSSSAGSGFTEAQAQYAAKAVGVC
jgi:hypothetical protein